MYTIRSNYQKEIIIKNSKFITLLYKIDSVDEVSAILDNVKKEYPDAVAVFISPCVAKRAESYDNPNVDYVMNYEELGALFIAKKIQIVDLEENKYVVEASKQARNFGYSGGVAESVKLISLNGII